MVIQFAPGGSDVVARILCQKMGESLGQPFVIDNRPGAAGVIGANIVAKAAPDGYTTLFATASFAVTAAFARPLPYDTIRDFDSIGFIGSQPFLLVVHPSVPVQSVKEYIAQSKVKPLNFASAGGGGIGHLSQELFHYLVGVKATHVPYKGTGPMVTALLAGEVPSAFINISGAWPHARAPPRSVRPDGGPRRDGHGKSTRVPCGPCDRRHGAVMQQAGAYLPGPHVLRVAAFV